MLFSLSPFIACAVSTMIGRSANCGIRRMALSVAFPSSPGIITSISTSETSSFRSSASIPVRPFSAYSTSAPNRSNTLVSAKTLRASSSTMRILAPSSGSSPVPADVPAALGEAAGGLVGKTNRIGQHVGSVLLRPFCNEVEEVGRSGGTGNIELPPLTRPDGGELALVCLTGPPPPNPDGWEIHFPRLDLGQVQDV